MESDLHAPDETLVEDGQYVFVFASDKTSRRYWVDPANMQIQKIQFLDQKGKLVLEQSFDNFEDVNGFAMPYTICVTQPKARQKLRFSYSEILVNTAKLPFTFTIPSNAERIHW